MKLLTSLNEISLALAERPVFCDIAQPAAVGIVVRDVRRFNADKLDRARMETQTGLFNRTLQGKAVGYEVLTLEGWHIPEKVYTK